MHDAHQLMESAESYVRTRFASGNDIGAAVSTKQFLRFRAEKKAIFIAIIKLKKLFAELIKRKEPGNFEKVMNAIVEETRFLPSLDQLDKASLLEFAKKQFQIYR